MVLSFRNSRDGVKRQRFDLALILLGRAADRDDRTLLPTSVTWAGAEVELVLTRLLDEGLIEEIPVEIPEQTWRSDGEGRFGLRMTAAGLKAIGVSPLACGVASGWDGRPLR